MALCKVQHILTKAQTVTTVVFRLQVTTEPKSQEKRNCILKRKKIL